MRPVVPVAVCVCLIAGVGCGSKAQPLSLPSPSVPDLIDVLTLKDHKPLEPGGRWVRELDVPTAGLVRFLFTSQGPFKLWLVTANGYRAIQAGEEATLTRNEVLIYQDTQNLTARGSAVMSVGKAYLIVVNTAGFAVDFQVETH